MNQSPRRGLERVRCDRIQMHMRIPDLRLVRESVGQVRALLALLFASFVFYRLH